jgi:hypothetical protein
MARLARDVEGLFPTKTSEESSSIFYLMFKHNLSHKPSLWGPSLLMVDVWVINSPREALQHASIQYNGVEEVTTFCVKMSVSNHPNVSLRSFWDLFCGPRRWYNSPNIHYELWRGLLVMLKDYFLPKRQKKVRPFFTLSLSISRATNFHSEVCHYLRSMYGLSICLAKP